MISFLDRYEIISNTQFGFRKNMGTETALLNYIEFLKSELTNYKYIISVFLDLSKAFDVIDHKILKIKLEYYGFRGKFLEFLMSFIKDRKYFVHINGINSDTKSVNIGVPQGSTLGPLLFLIYINDMIYCSNLFFLTQFADDSTATYSSTSLEHAIAIVEIEMKKILEWLAANKLIINLNKTHLMLFTNRARPQSLSISIDGQTINEVTETKFLGVMLDNKLNWNAHIKYISKKISKSTSLLKMLKFTFPSRVLKSLYHSLVYPYYSYCNIIWGGATKTAQLPLVLLQKKCVRIICKARYLANTGPLFEQLNLLQVQQIYNLSCARFIHHCYNKKSYEVFKDKLITNSSIHNYNTRSKDLLRRQYERLNQFTNSFLNNGIDIWNSLPIYMKGIKSIDTFKIHYKRLVLNKKKCKKHASIMLCTWTCIKS